MSLLDTLLTHHKNNFKKDKITPDIHLNRKIKSQIEHIRKDRIISALIYDAKASKK